MEVKGWQNVNLEWGNSDIEVFIFRNDNHISDGVVSGGSYLDPNIAKGGASYTYKYCAALEMTDCSDEAQVVF